MKKDNWKKKFDKEMDNFVRYGGRWHNRGCYFVFYDNGVCNCKTGNNNTHIKDFIQKEIDKAEERAYKEWERVNGCKQCFHICHDKIKLDKMLAKAKERGRAEGGIPCTCEEDGCMDEDCECPKHWITVKEYRKHIKQQTIKEIKEMIMGEDIALKPETKNGYNTAIKDIINYLNR